MQLGFIGLGIMGSRQAANLRRAGHELTVFNRTRATAEAWAAEHGGHVADRPSEVAERADVVFCMLVDGPQVREALLDAAAGARPGALFVTMATIAPGETKALAAELDERGIAYLDAPVTGSAPKAADGTLTIICGGEAADVERARPALSAMGSLVVHAGPVGHGATIKLLNNAVAAINAATLAEALTAASGTGVDLEALVTVMRAGSGDSTMLRLKAEPMLEHDFPAMFKLDHMLKDVRLCLDACSEAGIPFPAAGAAEAAYAGASALGEGDADFAAVLVEIERRASVTEAPPTPE